MFDCSDTAHLIDISEETSTKSCMDYVRVLVGCENLVDIPREFNAVIGEQLCAIKIEVKCSWGVPREMASSMVREGLDTSITSVLVGEMGTYGAGLVGTFDRPFTKIVLHLVGNWRSYIWKRVEDHTLPINWCSAQLEPTDEISEIGILKISGLKEGGSETRGEGMNLPMKELLT